MGQSLDSDVRAGVVSLFTEAPFVAEMGIVPTQVETGVCHAELLVGPRHLQHLGRAHGGVITTLAGHAALGAASTVSGPGGLVAPAFSLQLMRAVGPGPLTAKARVIKGGKKLIFVEVEIVAGLDLVATASYTLMPVTP